MKVGWVLVLLGAICGSAISMEDLAAQSMDPYSVQKSMDCAEIRGSHRVRSTGSLSRPYLNLNLTFMN